MSKSLAVTHVSHTTEEDIATLLWYIENMVVDSGQPKINPRSCDWEMLEQDDKAFHYCTKCMRVVPFGEYLEVDEDCPAEQAKDA